MTRTNEAWERVLAAVEADAARAAAALAGDEAAIDSLNAEQEADEPEDHAIPSTWRLPGNPDVTLAMPAGLPDPADMPPIPEELRLRIERLRDRITALQTDLASAMKEAAQAMPPPRHAATERPAPGFVDRRI